MSDCIFCKVIANEVPSYTVYEDGNTRAFLDIMPSGPGHTMVVHKKHGETIYEYSEQELGQLMKTVQLVAAAIQKSFDTTVLTIGINHGEEAGVHHLHVHLIPRHNDDGGKVIQSLTHKEVKKEELSTIQEKIKSSI